MIERGVLPAPLLYLSAFFEATREEYYARLRGIQEHAEWEAWMRYFLEGVTRQSEDAPAGGGCAVLGSGPARGAAEG